MGIGIRSAIKDDLSQSREYTGQRGHILAQRRRLSVFQVHGISSRQRKQIIVPVL